MLTKKDLADMRDRLKEIDTCFDQIDELREEQDQMRDSISHIQQIKTLSREAMLKVNTQNNKLLDLEHSIKLNASNIKKVIDGQEQIQDLDSLFKNRNDLNAQQIMT